MASIIPFPLNQERDAYSGMVVDLGAICRNYLTIQKEAIHSMVGAVVKANAYGLGAKEIAKSLYIKGCRHFFTAFLDEAFEVKKALEDFDDVSIYVLNGLMKGTEKEFLHNNFIPVLTDFEKVERWISESFGTNSPCCLHFDTGMNRTGIPFKDFDLFIEKGYLKKLNVSVVMSHLACGDEKDSLYNAIQLSHFKTLKEKLLKILPKKPLFSLANSAGILLEKEFHQDLCRPGLALYGVSPSAALPLTPTVRIWSKIYQIRHVLEDETVGYGQTYILATPKKIATVCLGYADGCPWALGKDSMNNPYYVMIQGIKAPVVGRVSMDLITVDVTHIPENLIHEGTIVDFLNHDITAADAARHAGSLPYEIFLNLGCRLRRNYVET
jgi:alanine racemase